mmetsp:Transcript_65693/g.175804  ORF Transcript_65693/g.175804 Transcript_65693/m.175804 type:complete len:234 (-) Transcript_65693:57-758(-)
MPLDDMWAMRSAAEGGSFGDVVWSGQAPPTVSVFAQSPAVGLAAPQDPPAAAATGATNGGATAATPTPAARPYSPVVAPVAAPAAGAAAPAAGGDDAARLYLPPASGAGAPPASSLPIGWESRGAASASGSFGEHSWGVAGAGQARPVSASNGVAAQPQASTAPASTTPVTLPAGAASEIVVPALGKLSQELITLTAAVAANDWDKVAAKRAELGQLWERVDLVLGQLAGPPR